VFQVVVPQICLRCDEGVFSLCGQLQPVCGTDGANLSSPALVYSGVQAGEVYHCQQLKDSPTLNSLTYGYGEIVF
jgi:hypothetical protein